MRRCRELGSVDAVEKVGSVSLHLADIDSHSGVERLRIIDVCYYCMLSSY